MGSDFVIVNDTEFEVWITTGINWSVLATTIAGIGAVVSGGALLAGLATRAAAGGVIAGVGGGALIMAEEGIIMGA